MDLGHFSAYTIIIIFIGALLLIPPAIYSDFKHDTGSVLISVGIMENIGFMLFQAYFIGSVLQDIYVKTLSLWVLVGLNAFILVIVAQFAFIIIDEWIKNEKNL